MAQQVVYFLPGLLCDKGVWAHQGATLAPVADVRFPVFRGFNSLRAMADYVLESAPPRFSVVGHSMGGRIVWEMLALAGNRINKVAVLNTGVHGLRPDEAGQRDVLVQAARMRGLQAVVESWIGPMLHPANRQDERLVDEIATMLLRNTVDDYVGQVEALLGREDRTPLLARLTQKVWLMTGDQDEWSSPQQHRDMQAHLRESELRIIPGAGHMSTMEQPEQVSKLLMEWLHD